MPRKKPPRPRGPQLELAGALCVAFVNTSGARPQNRQQGVSNVADLVTWGREVEIVSAQEAERLRRWAAERPTEAKAELARVTTIRAGLARIFIAGQRQEPAHEGDLDVLNRTVAESSLALQLVATDSGASWGWAGGDDELDALLSPILSSAVEVMNAAAGRPHVRQCAGEGCRLFFVDRSPTGQRVWCEKSCGHRVANLRYWRRRGKKRRV